MIKFQPGGPSLTGPSSFGLSLKENPPNTAGNAYGGLLSDVSLIKIQPGGPSFAARGLFDPSVKENPPNTARSANGGLLSDISLIKFQPGGPSFTGRDLFHPSAKEDPPNTAGNGKGGLIDNISLINFQPGGGGISARAESDSASLVGGLVSGDGANQVLGGGLDDLQRRGLGRKNQMPVRIGSMHDSATVSLLSRLRFARPDKA